MEYGKWLIDRATAMCEPPSRYELAQRLKINEQNLSAVYLGKRPFPAAWAAPMASVAGVEPGEAVLRVLAERAGAKKPPLKVAGFARMSGLGYTSLVAAGVSLTPELLTRAIAWLDRLRIVSM